MNSKLLLITALLSVSSLTLSESKEVKEEIKVMIEKNDDGNVSKKVIMNGKELSDDEIKELEASGKLNVLHLDDELHGEHGKKMKKMIVIDSDEEGSDEKHVKIIKKHMSGGDHKNVWVSKHGEENQDVEVEISKDGKKTIEKIIINGKELSVDEIKDMKASGDLKVIRLDDELHREHGNKMIFIGDEEGEHGNHVKVIKKHLADGDRKNVWVSKLDDEAHKEIKIIKDEDGNETITVNGKELSADEAKKFKESDEMNVFQFDSSDGLHEFKIITDSDGKDGKHVIKKRFVMSGDDDPNRGRLGFMADVQDDGWHVTSVVAESGAKAAGIKKGDIIVKVGDKDLTNKGDKSGSSSMKLSTYKVGDKVPVKVNRDGKSMDVTVEAKALKSESEQNIEWVTEIETDVDFGDTSSKWVFINKEGDFEFNEDDIHISFPESLKDLNVFISDGKSTSKLLGKRHKFSSMSDDLAEYFDTKGGVLVLSVDSKNVFGLKDGDVVKKVNGNNVDSPKAIIKELLKAEEQKKITLKVVRHKKNKTLKAKL